MARQFLFLFLLLLPCIAAAQDVQRPTKLTLDSLPRSLVRNWRMSTGDDPAMASPAYNDSSWKPVDSRLRLDRKDTALFKGLGWFRLHFSIDSTLAGIPMALAISQSGASEIYLDGKRIAVFGEIGDKAHTTYEDPQKLPLVIMMPHAGAHVLAVRYSNYHGRYYFQKYNRKHAGFTIDVYEADDAIRGNQGQTIFTTFAFTLLFTLFLTLAIVHFLLYLYYRAARSNLYFSVFSACIAFTLITPFFMRILRDPGAQLSISFWVVLAGSIACASFSGFINELFSRRKLRFHVIVALCLLVCVLRFISFDVSFVALIAVIVIISLEGVILISSALYRRVKGAGIIGAGMLFFALLMLYIIISSVAVEGFEIRDDTPAGQILESIIVLAVISMPLSMSAYLAWSFATVNRSLKTQLDQVQLLSEKTLAQEAEKQRMLESRSEELEREVAVRTEELRRQKKKSDDLLLNILPEEIAEELKETGKSEARLYNEVSVLFTDFVNFTQMSENMSPSALVSEIDHCFKAFDAIIEKHGLEKIKTVGDAYIAVSGMPAENRYHARDVVHAALDIRNFMLDRQHVHPAAFGIRLGIHSGPVVAGIVGVKKFAYDIWGDTVNTAARMEQHSETGRINISASTFELVKESFACSYRGELEAKHKGVMRMYFVDGVL